MDRTLSSLFPHTWRYWLLVAVVAVAVPVRAPAQLLDSGTFVLNAGGREIGTEEFTIRRLGTGDAQVTVATGSLSLRDGRTVTTTLRLVGTAMTLNEYEVSVSGSDTLAVRVVRDGNRLRTRTVGPWGEEAREYRARASTVIFDDGVVHHHFLLRTLVEAYGADTRIHAVAPLAEMTEHPMRPDVGSETIEIGGERVETTRFRLSSEGESRTAWFDGSGRLVRVVLAARGLEAVRLP